MKKTSKILAVVLVAALAVATLCVLAACGGETYTGECKYENTWNKGSYYGAKVDVTVKGEYITKVKLYSEQETGWTRTSAGQTGENAKWTATDHDETEAAYTSWIKQNIVGQTVATVLGWSANASEKGQTISGEAPNIERTAGATSQQSAARIICAVQNALEKIEGISKYTGEAKYENSWTPGAYYGAKVDVYMQEGKIIAVKLYEEKETGWTRTSAGQTQEGAKWTPAHHDATEAAYASWIKSKFVGKTAAEVNAYVATCTQAEQSVGEGLTIQITGGTAKQSAARIICAVKDALSKIGA